MKIIGFIFLLISWEAFAINFDFSSDKNAEKTVILLGFSGLRWDSIVRGGMPVLNSLGKHGVLAIQKRGTFQSETLPAFQTIVTGLFPEKHGMISNRIRDMNDGAIFTPQNRKLRWWGEAEPVWVTHEKKNPNQTALCFWPGHDAEYKNISIKYTCLTTINGSVYVDPFKELAQNAELKGNTLPFGKRIEIISGWLKSKNRPKFIAAFFEEPFKTAISKGLGSKDYLRALASIDHILELLVKDLKRMGIFHKVNLIITGESGITEILNGKEIYLEDYLPQSLKDSYDVISNNGIMTLMPKRPADIGILFSKLNHSNPNMVVYKKTTLPNNFHFKHPTRTPPLILVAKEGWRLFPKRVKNPNDKRKAFMGYASSNPSTHALFIAHGPAFKSNVRLNSMQNVDVYQLICQALKLDPKPHNGSGYVQTRIIAKVDKWYWHMAKTVVRSTTGLTAVIVVSLCLFFLSLYAVINFIYNAKSRCSCPRRRPMPQLRKQAYRESHREGVKHLLSDEEELSGSDIELGSDIDSDFDLKHIQS